MYQALYRKYRPRTFDDVVGQEHVTQTLRRQIESGRTSHAYLFVGTRGTGKTSCAKILSRALNCEHPSGGNPCNECPACLGIENGTVMDVAEIDAASNNGVDDIRAIRDEAVFTPASVKKRVYIIDEVHMLSGSAWSALLKILEEPPEHLVFILATTEVRKIPATILSRCQRFSFRRILPDDIKKRLLYVAEKEGISLTDGAAALLSRLADGSLRDALSLLDQCASAETVDETAVFSAVGLAGSADTAGLFSDLVRGSAPDALALFEKLYFGGRDPASVLSELLSLCRDMLMARLAPGGCSALLSGAFGEDALKKMSAGLSAETLARAARAIQDAVSGMAAARDKRTAAELCLISLCGLFTGAPRPAQAPAAPADPAPRAMAPAARRPAPAVPPEEPEPAEEPEPPEDEPPEEEPPEEEPPEGPEPLPGGPPEPEPPRDEAPEAAQPLPQTAPPGNPGEPDGWWARVLTDVKPALDTAWLFLSNETNVSASLSGGMVTLHASNAFIRNMVDSAAVKEAVGKASSRILGRSVAVKTELGGVTPPAGTADKLSELEKFGNIKFE